MKLCKKQIYKAKQLNSAFQRGDTENKGEGKKNQKKSKLTVLEKQLAGTQVESFDYHKQTAFKVLDQEKSHKATDAIPAN